MSDNKNHIAAVYQLLVGDAATIALVGTNIFPGQVPQKNGYPAIVYSQLGENRIETKDGPVEDGYRFTLEIYADIDDAVGGYVKAQSIATAAKNLLEYYNGTTDGTRYRIRFVDQTDATYEDVSEVFKIVQDYTLRIN
jgi:hypothetical protein